MRTGLAAALVALFVVLNVVWLGEDRLVRDGDEEGHVGAAEMFVQDLREGNLHHFTQRALWEDMGDYPSLYPAAVGAWWHLSGEGQPGAPPVRAVNLVFLLICAGSVAGTAALLGAREGALVGGAAVLFIPLSTGLSRHFMPEGALAAAVALAVLAAAWQRRRPDWLSAVLLGLALGIGFLTKQTVVLYAALPVLVLIKPSRTLLALPAGALIALPWILGNMGEQLDYASQSAGYPGSLSDHVLYYPQALWQPALGPVWLGLLVAAGAAAGRPRGRAPVLVALVWLVGGVVVLTLVPKKYDRLLVPLLPAVGLVIAAGVQARPRWAPLVLAGVGWTSWVSFSELSIAGPSPRAEAFHPGCVQVWLRPPVPDDLGYPEVADFVRTASPGPVRVIDGPGIDCSVQTTHGWTYHLGPYLRREGLDREVIEDGRGMVTVDFSSGGPDAIEIPLLDAAFTLE